MRQGMKSLLNAMKIGLFDQGGLEEIFRHARNLVVTTLIVAAGIHAIDNASSMSALGVFDFRVVGYFVGVIGIVLFCLNLADGLYRLSKVRGHLFFQIATVAIYLFVTVRVAQLIIALRTT
jgi:hypothetical protein